MDLVWNTKSVKVAGEMRDGYLRLSFSGPYLYEDYRAVVGALPGVCKKLNVTRVLVDLLAVEGELPNIDRFNLGVLWAEITGTTLRAGMLAAREKINKLFENAAVNRYADVRTMDNEAELLEWLLRS